MCNVKMRVYCVCVSSVSEWANEEAACELFSEWIDSKWDRDILI